MVNRLRLAEPQFSRTRVNRAGRTLVSPQATAEEQAEALVVVNNWRASHNFPLNTFQTTLRDKAHKVDAEALIAQRLKRMSSIERKLRLQPNMQLSQMQDIGGCRAIVSSVSDVEALVKRYVKSDLKHDLHEQYDYIANPKRSGYRSHHLVFRYKSDKITTYNGLRIEMQFRSARQHAWATAVETIGIFIQQALKSSQGETDWLRFFALMGTAIANREGTPAVPDTPTDPNELRDELRHYAENLAVVDRLRSYVDVIGQPTKHTYYVLVKLDAINKQTELFAYDKNQLNKATDDYAKIEEQITDTSGIDAVLVSVGRFEDLRSAYPNYFLDADAFIEEVESAIS